MRPNRYMNGGPDQTSQNAYYVDDNVPRLILSISTHSIRESESFVLVSAITKSSDNSIWHSDVIDPKMRAKTDTIEISLNELIFNL